MVRGVAILDHTLECLDILAHPEGPPLMAVQLEDEAECVQATCVEDIVESPLALCDEHICDEVRGKVERIVA